MDSLLSIRRLCVAFPGGEGWTAVLREISFEVAPGEMVGLVGESGSGKSMTALAVLRLLPGRGRITGGRILLEGRDLLELPEEEMRRVRGARVGMIFQEPMSALNPVFTVGFQVTEAVRAHSRIERRSALREAERLLDLVAIPEPRQRLKDYPHQLSGGQRQRVMAAIALAAKPDLLIADEPTSALDVTVQAQLLELLDRLRLELGLSILLITHDLAVVAETCDRAVVMYAGQVVEEGPVAELFAAPAHPYTRGLMRALPRPEDPGGEALATIPGQVPDMHELPAGCSFHPRCEEAMEACRRTQPELVLLEGARRARCLLHDGPVSPGEGA